MKQSDGPTLIAKEVLRHLNGKPAPKLEQMNEVFSEVLVQVIRERDQLRQQLESAVVFHFGGKETSG